MKLSAVRRMLTGEDVTALTRELWGAWLLANKDEGDDK